MKLNQDASSATDNVFLFLRALEGASISYSLSSTRPGTLRIDVSVPGERWEVEFLEDGDVWVEIFRSSGAIEGRQALDDLFERFSD